MTAAASPVDDGFVSIPDAIADALTECADGLGPLSPDTRRGLEQALSAARAQEPLFRRAHEIDGELRALDARNDAERARRQAVEAEGLAIKSMLAAEREALQAAGLVEFNGSDTTGHARMDYYQQQVVLLNSNAHPTALMATALARAERAQAFARVLEVSDLVREDKCLEAGTYTLARMIEEVVDLLQVVHEHDAIRWAPPSAMRAS